MNQVFTKRISKKKLRIPYNRIFGSLISLLILLIIIGLQFSDEILIILVFIGAAAGSWFFVIESIEAVFKKHKITTDVLMTLAFIGAMILNQYAESLMLVFLYSITETLETITIQRTRFSIESLLDLIPNTINKLEKNAEVKIQVEYLQKNDIIVLRPGDRSPIDGILIFGKTFVNESIITGESIERSIMVGDRINAGSFISDGMIHVRVTNIVSESSIAKIIYLVEEAQKNKTPTQQLINRFTRYFNPFVIFLSIITIFIWTLISGNFNESAIMGITVLVAAAPCALAIGIPVTVIAALGTAGRNKILVKGGLALEILGQVDAIVFDKTGTLTIDRPVLKEIIPEKSYSVQTILEIASTLEYTTNHPFAKAILEKAEKESIDYLKNELNITDQTTIPGIGVKGKLKDVDIFLGSVKEELLDDNLLEHYKDSKEKGYSVISLTINQKIAGLFEFEDIIRDEAKSAIESLNKINIKSFLLTGDNKLNAIRVAEYLGIPTSHVYWNKKPKDKASIIKELKKTYKLGMVGDGINDAPSLALADIGIAMGSSGTDTAIETADISILTDDLSQITTGIILGKKMRKVVLQNIILSSLIIFGVTAGIFIGLVDLPLAILAHEGSEVLIVGNSFRMLSK